MGLLNAQRQQLPPHLAGAGAPDFTRQMAATGQLQQGAPQPQHMQQPQMGSPFAAPQQQMLMGAGFDSGSALNMASAMQMQADPLAGYRLAAWLQPFPQKQPTTTLGRGR